MKKYLDEMERNDLNKKLRDEFESHVEHDEKYFKK